MSMNITSVLLPMMLCCARCIMQAVLQVMLHSTDELERAGAGHLLAAFCHNNNLGQMAVLSTVVYAGEHIACSSCLACVNAPQHMQHGTLITYRHVCTCALFLHHVVAALSVSLTQVSSS